MDRQINECILREREREREKRKGEREEKGRERRERERGIAWSNNKTTSKLPQQIFLTHFCCTNLRLTMGPGLE